MRSGRRTRTSRSDARAEDGAEERLIARARAAIAHAHAPHSGLRVGAAVVDAEGRVFTGCNVESASYGLTLCAERVAVAKAVSEGAGALVALAVATERPRPVMPCGACRQVLSELAPRLRVVAAGAGRTRRRATIDALLPAAFGAADLP